MFVCVVCFAAFPGQESTWGGHCADVLYTMVQDPDREPAAVISALASRIRPITGFNADDSRIHVTQMLEAEVRRYKAVVPEDPDEDLAYYTGSWNPLTMLTSGFAQATGRHRRLLIRHCLAE